MASIAGQAAKLKEDGNRLYALKDYAAAHGKYSKAIALDTNNAVLYANRAACLFAMEKYLDAIVDCEKATKIDPLYTKAWARMGAAYKNIPGCTNQSINAYERALGALPVENLSEMEKNIKSQCENELAFLKRRAPKRGEHIIASASRAEKMPWKRALSMKSELEAQLAAGTVSSAWVILAAYEEFTLGMDMIKTVKKTPLLAGGPPMLLGNVQGIQWLSNGIITDSRVFHLDDPKFVQKYNLQVELEMTAYKGFMKGGAENLIAEAPKMLAQSGWDATRLATATTIRCWLMSAFFTDGLHGNHAGGLQLYDEVIQVLEWGRQAWRDVPREQRGTVFDDTFLRSVRCLRLDCYMKANAGDSVKFPLEMLYQDAQDMLHELEAASVPSDIAPGSLLAFWVYPKGQALALIGLYYRELGKAAQSRPGATTTDEALSYFREAAKSYQKAAEVYPADEENHVYYLCCAYDMLAMGGSYTVGEVLAIGEKVRAALPGMKKIWEFSVLSAARDISAARVLAAETDLRKDIEAGRCTADSQVAPAMTR